MKTLPVALVLSTVGLAFVLASPAEAAKSSKHKKTAAGHSTIQRQATAVQPKSEFQGGVLKGPLYNGPDYIGDDPDPNIRARLMKDMTRYQGSY